jgi:P27 family predicted phage terminase small subunit
MRAGRKPDPTVLKLHKGNPGKRPLNKNEPRARPGSRTPPPWLDRVAKQEWRRVVPELHRLGLNTVLDRPAIACYCQTYSRLVAAQKEIAKNRDLSFLTPNGSEQQRPEIGIFNQAQKQLLSWCAEFGMTPSSRTRIVADPGGTDSPKDERFFG